MKHSAEEGAQQAQHTAERGASQAKQAMEEGQEKASGELLFLNKYSIRDRLLVSTARPHPTHCCRRSERYHRKGVADLPEREAASI